MLEDEPRLVQWLKRASGSEVAAQEEENGKRRLRIRTFPVSSKRFSTMALERAKNRR